MKIKVVFVHGVCDQSTNFATKLMSNIRRFACSSMNIDEYSSFVHDVTFESLVWADAISGQISDYDQAVYTTRNIFWNAVSRRVEPLVLQILSYVHQKDRAILDDFAADFKRATDGADKVIIVAHSLGTVIAFDYLLKHTDTKVDTLVTMGSPLPLFAAAMGHSEGLTILPNNIVRWVNIYSKRDPIAKPLHAMFPVTDINVGTKFMPLSAHTAYWRSAKVANAIAQIITKINNEDKM